jgi:histidine ammonia-lyase
LAIECEVQAQHVSATGHLDLRQWLAQSKVVEHMTSTLVPDASGQEPWIELIDQALRTTDDTPEQLVFEVSQLTDQPTWTVAQEVVQWLAGRLTSQASQHVAKHYVQASEQLDVVVQRKLGEQTRMVALLRNDAEQQLGQQLEELRKLQAAVNTHIQQRVGTHFARQPQAEVPR